MDRFEFILGVLILLIAFISYCVYMGHNGVLINTTVGILAAVITWVTKGSIEKIRKERV